MTTRHVLHFIDNSAAVFGIAKGYSGKFDSAKIINAFHALNIHMGALVEFKWVESESNFADSPSRGDFALLEEFGSVAMPLVVPPVDSWLTPHVADSFAPGSSAAPGSDEAPSQSRGVEGTGPVRRQRGGRRAR